jgi:hypothetical protein
LGSIGFRPWCGQTRCGADGANLVFVQRAGILGAHQVVSPCVLECADFGLACSGHARVPACGVEQTWIGRGWDARLSWWPSGRGQEGPQGATVGAALSTTCHRPALQWGQHEISMAETRRMNACASSCALGLEAGMANSWRASCRRAVLAAGASKP